MRGQKQTFNFLVIVLFLILGSCFSTRHYKKHSTAPNENEWIRMSVAGFNIIQSGFLYSVGGRLKGHKIKYMQVEEFLGEQRYRTIGSLYSKDIKGNLAVLNSKPQSWPFYRWLYDRNTTVKSFRVTLYDFDGKSKSLHQSAKFSANSKKTTALILQYNRKGYEISFIGRKWKLGNISENYKQSLHEYTLANEDLKSWKELYSESFAFVNSGFNVNLFLPRLKKLSFQKCPKSVWKNLEKSSNPVAYIWYNGGCKNEDNTELAVMGTKGEYLFIVRYTKKTSSLKKSEIKNILKDLKVKYFEKEF